MRFYWEVKHMIKILQCVFSFVFLFILVAALTSCHTIGKQGIGEFSPHDSATELTQYLIPEGFLEMFPFIDGDYDYFDTLTIANAYETAIIYVKYEERIYEQAKAYALTHMEFADNSEVSYKGYCFQQRIWGYELEVRRCYFAYSDEMQILLAVGTNVRVPEDYQYTSIESYFDTYFPSYNFETGKIERKATESESITKTDAEETTMTMD